KIVPLYAGGYAGDGLVYRDDRVYVGDVGEDSVWYRSGFRPGDEVLGVRDYNFRGRTRDEIATYLEDDPLLAGVDIRSVRNGAALRTKLGTIGAVVDVRLDDVGGENISPDEFNAVISLTLREPAEYRITNEAGEALTDWQTHGAASFAKFVTSPIPRTADDEYKLFVERMLDGATRRYELPFKLTTTSP
ncbi:MAG: hypothetical protein KDA41_08125, partial [Planctomycetales bacterium]|nr:hypothetical protein [Planctomycetales bacterium]